MRCWSGCGAAAPMAYGSRQACCIAATTGGDWRGCSASPLPPACRCWRPTRCCTTIPSRRPLQDVAHLHPREDDHRAIGKRLEANAERHLKPAEEMARLFRDVPEAIAETMRFAGRIAFSLDQLKYQYPDEPVPPGKTAQQHLEDLTWQGAHKYFRPEFADDHARHLAQGTAR